MMVRRSRRPGPDQMAFDLGPGFPDQGRVFAELAKSNRAMDETSQSAVALARSGNPTELMPYRPTPSINPPRPRTQAMGYVAESNSMFVQFREGAVYEYMDVSPQEWRNMRRVKSPGKSINRTFNAKPYTRRYDLE